MTLLVFGGVVLSAIAIVFGRMGVWAAAAAFLVGLVLLPFAFVAMIAVIVISDGDSSGKHDWGHNPIVRPYPGQR